MVGLVNDALNFITVSVLPWIPHTTSAVALRLMELDSAILYTPDQKLESLKEAEARQFIVSIEFIILFFWSDYLLHARPTPLPSSIAVPAHI